MMTDIITITRDNMWIKSNRHQEINFQKELWPSMYNVNDKKYCSDGRKIKRNKKCLTKCSSMQIMMRKQELLC